MHSSAHVQTSYPAAGFPGVGGPPQVAASNPTTFLYSFRLKP